MVVATIGALVFQFGHLVEHTLQMAMWMVHPRRGPWMSPIAQELSLWFGGVGQADSAEMSLSMARGMELLHLIGNSIFLAGATGVVVLVGGPARRWAALGWWFQALHTLEHVALTATMLAGGRAIGVSNWFGRLDGTTLTTQRVWWHGLVNLFATALVARAVVLARRSRRTRRSRSSPRVVVGRLTPARAGRAAAAVVLAAPTTIAALTGGAPTPAVHHRTASAVHTEHEAGLVDVAAARGLDVTHSAFRWDTSGDPVAMMGSGLCWIDVDADGWLDLFVTDTWSDGEWGLWNQAGDLPTSRLFRNDGGHFVEVTEGWGVDVAARAVGCTVADVDADGDDDLYVTTSRANLLFRNDDDRFTEVGAVAGVDLYGWQAGAAFGDLDGDGLLDLVAAGYADLTRPRDDSGSGFPATVEARPDRVLFGAGVVDGVARFVEADAASLGMEPDGPEYGLDVALFDADGDGDLDVYVANDTQPNRLYRNDLSTGGGFVDVAPVLGVDDDGSGMGLAVGDLDLDGTLDLAVTNLAGQGHGVFVSNPPSAGWEPAGGALAALGDLETGWGTAFVDLDLDGVLDAVVASGDIPVVSDSEPRPVTVFRGELEPADGGVVHRFVAWSPDGPPLPTLHGRGVAPADFDNDGDIDLAIASVGGPLVLLENRLGAGASLTIDPGQAPAGTIIEIEFDDGGGDRRQVTSGGGWLSSGDPRVVVALQVADAVGAIEERAPVRITIQRPGQPPETIQDD